MPRPKIDRDKVKARILTEAEQRLEATNGKRLVLSEISEQLGMSQSYLHSFFPTKTDLIRELARQWFAAVEALSAREAEKSAPPAQKLESWVLSILQEKRARFDRNPDLFRAYLQLAEGHGDLVQGHVVRLREDLCRIVAEGVRGRDLETHISLIEDCTLLFRTPHNIARFRFAATDERARQVCRMLTADW